MFFFLRAVTSGSGRKEHKIWHVVTDVRGKKKLLKYRPADIVPWNGRGKAESFYIVIMVLLVPLNPRKSRYDTNGNKYAVSDVIVDHDNIQVAAKVRTKLN